jgi:hypothetical protein
VCETGRNYIRKWAEDQKINIENCLVITLREYGVDSIRNNDIKELIKFISAIRNDFDGIVLVRDTDRGKIDPCLQVFPVCELASVNLELRAALYELAKLNVAVSSGPASLMQLNKNTKFIIAKFIHESVAPAREDFMIMKGFDILKQPLFLTNDQKWVWGHDSFNNLINAYNGIKWD